MEVLNVIAGQAVTEPSVLLFIGIAGLGLGLILLFLGLDMLEDKIILTGVIIGLFSLTILIFGNTMKPTGEVKPTRYEVMITDPDYVIDATKYKVIEKRDKIILLEEVK